MAMKTDCKLEFVRENDFVEYFLFPPLPQELEAKEINVDDDVDKTTEIRSYLDTVLKKCNEIVKNKVNEIGYIWQKDEFNLQIRTASAEERLLCEDVKAEDKLPPHLHGVTHYGDNILDEWFIVDLLNLLTKSISGLIARVIDSDGEFLLIEAADYLPDWANPDTCEQRVYIFEGCLHLVQNSPSNTTALLPVAKAISKLHEHPTLYRVSSDIQKCITARLVEFQKFNPNNFHCQIVRLPVTVAAMLKHHPALIAPAVRAFCERDTLDMKACRSMRFFPPEQQRVRTTVRFTRCLYAMLMSSKYVPDRKIGWNLSSSNNAVAYKEDLLGVKIASGFEILASQAKDNGSKDTVNTNWRNFVRSLNGKGYFRGNLEGSAEYNRLLEQAQTFFDSSNAAFSTASKVGSDILKLLCSIDYNTAAEQLTDEEIHLSPSEPDDWLNVTPEQLDAMLLERYGPKKLFKGNGDLNAEEFTKNLSDFLEKESGFDGIDSDFTDADDDVDVGDADDGDDDDDEELVEERHSKRKTSLKTRKDEFKAKVKKNNSMRKACNRNSVIINESTGSDTGTSKMPSAKSRNAATDEMVQSSSTNVREFLEFVIPEDNWESNSEMSEYEDEDELERNFEAMTKPDMNIDLDIQAFMRQMDKELSRTTIGKTFEREAAAAADIKTKKSSTNTKNGNCSKSSADTTDHDNFDDIESFEPININVNTLKNMMDSYKSQVGGAGPVTHLLSAMGVGMSAAAAEPATTAAVDELKESTV